MTKSPSRKKWLHDLGQLEPKLNTENGNEKSDDPIKLDSRLEEIVKDLKKGEKNFRIYQEFLKNPLKKEKGELVYRVEELSNKDNLLEDYDNKDDVKKILKDKPSDVKNQDKEWLSSKEISRNHVIKFKGEKIDTSYQGPKIYLYSDSNVTRKKNKGHDLIENLTKGKGIDEVVLDIINKEKGKGLKNESKEKIKEMSDLKKQVGKYSEVYTLPRLDRIISNVFDKHFENINEEDYSEYHNNESYRDWAKKIHNKIKNSEDGAYKNLKADQTLYATALVRNILDTYDKHVIISNDADMDTISEIVYKEILPKYVAETSKKEIKEQYKEDVELKDLEFIAKGLIHLGRLYEDLPNKNVGIAYNPTEEKFKTLDFAEPIAHYIRGEKKYTQAKNLTMYELYKVYKENKSGDVRKKINNKFREILV